MANSQSFHQIRTPGNAETLQRRLLYKSNCGVLGFSCLGFTFPNGRYMVSAGHATSSIRPRNVKQSVCGSHRNRSNRTNSCLLEEMKEAKSTVCLHASRIRQQACVG